MQTAHEHTSASPSQAVSSLVALAECAGADGEEEVDEQEQRDYVERLELEVMELRKALAAVRAVTDVGLSLERPCKPRERSSEPPQ